MFYVFEGFINHKDTKKKDIKIFVPFVSLWFRYIRA